MCDVGTTRVYKFVVGGADSSCSFEVSLFLPRNVVTGEAEDLPQANPLAGARQSLPACAPLSFLLEQQLTSASQSERQATARYRSVEVKYQAFIIFDTGLVIGQIALSTCHSKKLSRVSEPAVATEARLRSRRPATQG